ncbi:hypothetical protein O6H91_13G064100 [Diphasiastrum complanatum]|uniref:Uncharacterized protein n=1 Tax=Diphasiastrum complanatum TaxID=34168 RepID=A0ACC2BVI7_DIPCM|nr:hypothetical protein O6H91_Y053800 [Diphasiastrum complanatum]KAJ7533766.1 hypothetical protein O6H91_13G064100 [Diphasiastrum complanatum]
MATGGQYHNSVEFASNGWWANSRNHVRLLRSHLMSKSSDQKLEDELRALLSDYLAGYTSPLATMSSEEVLYMLGGQNHTYLEAAFMWLGGWRPTSVIVLVYSVLGVESRKRAQQSVNLSEFKPIGGVPLFSEKQLHALNSLQELTRLAEDDLSKKLAVLQMLIADQTMIAALSIGNWSKRREVFKTKISELRELLIQAEKLRKETLQELFSILNPIQAAKCSITAFELIFAFKSLFGISFGDRSLSHRTVDADSLLAEADGSTILITDASNGNAEDISSKQKGSFSFECGPISGVSLASHRLTTELPEKTGTDTSDFPHTNSLERVCGSAGTEG